MATLVSTGSPKPHRKLTSTVKVHEDSGEDSNLPQNMTKVSRLVSRGTSPAALQTDVLRNIQSSKGRTKEEVKENIKATTTMEDILERLRLNDARKPTPSHQAQPTAQGAKSETFDRLLTNLNDQNKILKKQEKDLKNNSSTVSTEAGISASSGLYTPATEAFEVSSRGTLPGDPIKVESAELRRIKQELEAAKSVINRQEVELAETRTLKHTMDQAVGSDIDFINHNGVPDQTMNSLHSSFNATARPFTTSAEPWNQTEPSRLERRGRALWHGQAPTQNTAQYLPTSTMLNTSQLTRPLAGIYGDQTSPSDMFPNSGRSFSSSSFASLGYESRAGLDNARRGPAQYGLSSAFTNDQSSAYGSYGNLNSTGLTPASISPIGPQVHSVLRVVLSTSCLLPLEQTFPAMAHKVFRAPGLCRSTQTYVTPLEPMNYRRLLDKSVSCDWKYIVDKIVCNNDQQASIFLQQKLKVGTAEQKFEIVEAIVNQAYPLMINRFGNFLVQRCFEHGTPEQVVAIADTVRGNVLALSMDAFGCHVIQKAFDSVPESHKADMVRELLRRIPDTVIHRYACHVWQKLFELRWSGEPPQIMLKVNDALRGMWHEVALGETGSLVVQNIFENCVEEEKRPAIEEVIANIDLIAHGQFGNWCIQHLCEHASPPDKRRVIDHILGNAYSYSIDQYASKVVEKCLKIGGIEFLDRYLGVITTSHPDRPRIPLIDISGDQYGNYLVQWILMNAHQHQREQVAVHIRKHMVSLRGSKFGSRVAMLCCNPASVTRPGPGAMVNPYGAPGQPRNGAWPRFH